MGKLSALARQRTVELGETARELARVKAHRESLMKILEDTLLDLHEKRYDMSGPGVKHLYDNLVTAIQEVNKRHSTPITTT